MPSISVIIPCYNVRKEYIEECIQSIYRQTFNDFELILIDDGSKEEYSKILDELSKQKNNILVYHQKNGGVSAARNKGMQIATGKYITFIDADDSITPWFFEQAFTLAEKLKADILYGYNYRDERTIKRYPQNDYPKFSKVTDEWLRIFHIGSLHVIDDKRFGRGPYCRLINSEVAKRVKFPLGVPIGEDVLWNLELINEAKSKYLVDTIWYRYIVRDDSVTCKYDTAIEERLEPFYQEIKRFITPKEHKTYLDRVRNDLRHYILKLYLGNNKNHDSFLQKWREFNAICQRLPWNEINDNNYIRSLSGLDKIEAILIKHHIYYPIWVFRKNVLHRQ